MTSHLRFAVTSIIAVAVSLLSLVVLGAVGLGRVPYIELPLALFVTALVIWPVATKALGLATQQRFADWAAFDVALTLLFALMLWSVTAWNGASPFLDELPR